MAVAAARDCLGPAEDRSRVKGVTLASSTLPFAERMNAGIVAEALTLDDDSRRWISPARSAPRSPVSAGRAKAATAARGDDPRPRRRRAADATRQPAELEMATAPPPSSSGRSERARRAPRHRHRLGRLRRPLPSAGEDIDYTWEERWIRDEGVSKLVPQASSARSPPPASPPSRSTPSSSRRPWRRWTAGRQGRAASAPTRSPTRSAADRRHRRRPPAAAPGPRAREGAPRQHILVAQFGSGAQALVFRVTDAIGEFARKVGVSGFLARGVPETNYTKFLSFKGQLGLEKGMRGEQDKKTALTTLYRHRKAILGLVAGATRRPGRCTSRPRACRSRPTPGRAAGCHADAGFAAALQAGRARRQGAELVRGVPLVSPVAAQSLRTGRLRRGRTHLDGVHRHHQGRDRRRHARWRWSSASRTRTRSAASRATSGRRPPYAPCRRRTRNRREGALTMASGIKDKVAILGMGCSKFGERWDASAEDLMVEAYQRGDDRRGHPAEPARRRLLLHAHGRRRRRPRRHADVASRCACRTSA